MKIYEKLKVFFTKKIVCNIWKANRAIISKFSCKNEKFIIFFMLIIQQLFMVVNCIKSTQQSHCCVLLSKIKDYFNNRGTCKPFRRHLVDNVQDPLLLNFIIGVMFVRIFFCLLFFNIVLFSLFLLSNKSN